MQFDAEVARKVEAIYLTPDVVEQRERVLAALALQPGARAVDLGCGPGLLAAAMAKQVGPSGEIEGLDLSESMLPLAQARCAEYAWVNLRVGDVAALPFEDASFDAAVCTQVYEYVQDIEQALQELRRVLVPGGRAVIVDTDWESCVWHSSDPERMRRMIECWDTHCPRPHLPRVLGRLLRACGLQVERQEVVPLLNPRYHANTYSYGMIDVLGTFAANSLGEEDARRWAEDLRTLGQREEYFFSLNRYLFVARRP